MTEQCRCGDFYNRKMHYETKRAEFQSPFDDRQDRVGQSFEIVGVDCSDELLSEGGGGPKFDILFQDGYVLQEADEIEVFSGVGWEPEAA